MQVRHTTDQINFKETLNVALLPKCCIIFNPEKIMNKKRAIRI